MTPTAGRTTYTQGSQTLARGLHVLQLLSDTDGMAASEVARALDVHQSVAYRILNTLAQFGLARRDSDSRYRIGVGIIALAHSARSGLRSAALPIIRRLAEETRCTCWLFVAEGGDAVALLAIEPSAISYSLRFLEGSRHPLDRGSAGYALTSLLPETPDDPEKVKQARAQGYVITHGEVDPRAWGVAAPIGADVTGLQVCINIAAHDQVLAEEAIPHLLGAAAELTAVLEQVER